MDPASQEPLFAQLICRDRIYKQFEQPFTPVGHDLIVLSPEGDLQIAENASVRQIINFLARSNKELAAIHDAGTDNAAELAVLRFDVDDDDHPQGPPSPSNDDWSQLWPFFDSCCNQDDNALNFVTRLHQLDTHCHSSLSKNSISNALQAFECNKLSYSLDFLGRHVLIMHHFHKINGEVKETVRIVTCGISHEMLEKVLCKSLLFPSIRSSESDNGSSVSVASPNPIPHPVVFLCCMLEGVEEWCSEKLETHRKRIAKIASDISYQRDPTRRKPKGFEISSMKLSETSIDLGVVRQKLQYILSSIASLEDMRGLPDGYRRLSPVQDKQLIGCGSPDALEGHLHHRWCRQLREAKVRLLRLKGKSEQHNINIENLQERIKGILSTVSILLAEKENEWSHQAMDKQQQTSNYQVKMIEYQVQMLRAQQLIASRTKRDNTVMKVIAVLTSLFLPGTFIATIFSVPVFNWNEENPIGPHFMTYWYFTAPITATLVIGFSAWFLKMWYDDKQEEKRQAKEDSQVDPERVGGV